MRLSRVMAEERGMIVGAREARFMLNSVGVRPDNENGVVERPCSAPGLTVAPRPRSGASPGLTDRFSPLFSSPSAASSRFS